MNFYNLPVTTSLTLIICFIICSVSAAELKVHFINVGQGDSILLQSSNKNMLVDAGPSEAGPKIVSYLQKLNVTYLNILVATHPHEDHIGGMIDILCATEVGLFVDNGATHNTSTYEKLINILADDQIPYSEVKAGKKIPFAPGIIVDVIHPYSLSGDMNQDSLILKISHENINILLTGDSSEIPENIQAQILKVPHHGSRNASNSFYLSQVQPKIAIICVGKDNDFGHPALETLHDLDLFGVNTYRTDNDGTIVISTDGNNWSTNFPDKFSSTLTFSQPKIFSK